MPSRPWSDWERNERYGRITVLVLRLEQERLRASPLRKLVLAPVAVARIVWMELLMGAEIPGAVRCGPGLRLPHGGRGVIVHDSVQIGADVTIYHRVTLGVRKNSARGPIVGDGVYIGVGASVLGPVTIGDGARIGAGAVVLDDVPPSATVVGVPARPVGQAR